MHEFSNILSSDNGMLPTHAGSRGVLVSMRRMRMGESRVDTVTATVSNLVSTVSMGAHIARSSHYKY